MKGRGSFCRAPDGAVLDTDGVLLDSTVPHAAAWKIAFDAFLDQRAPDGRTQPPFDADAEYRRFGDGRSRYGRAAAFLTVRSIHLPRGDPHDGPGCGTVRAVEAHKEEMFVDLLRLEGVTAFNDARPALAARRTSGVPCADGFGFVAGVDRTPPRRTVTLLRDEGADLVVPGLTPLVRSVWGERA